LVVAFLATEVLHLPYFTDRHGCHSLNAHRHTVAHCDFVPHGHFDRDAHVRTHSHTYSYAKYDAYSQRHVIGNACQVEIVAGHSACVQFHAFFHIHICPVAYTDRDLHPAARSCSGQRRHPE